MKKISGQESPIGGKSKRRVWIVSRCVFLHFVVVAPVTHWMAMVKGGPDGARFYGLGEP